MSRSKKAKTDSTLTWKNHVENLTSADLCSADQCYAHLNFFTEHLVASGLVSTPLRNEKDIIAIVAAFLRDSVDMPHAAALRVITNEAQRIQIAETIEYLGKEAKKCAMAGQSTAAVMLTPPSRSYLRRREYKIPACVDELEKVCGFNGAVSMEDVLKVIVDTLQPLGYEVAFEWTCPGQGTGCSGICERPEPRGLWTPRCKNAGHRLPNVTLRW